MNRKDRREIEKKEKKLQKLYGSLHQQLSNIELRRLLNESEDDALKEGDRVKLNVKRIMKRSDYARMQDTYKQFVSDNQNRIFTVHLLERNGSFPAIVTFQEDDTWHFWHGDLIRVRV